VSGNQATQAETHGLTWSPVASVAALPSLLLLLLG
jgi:hypothetical protein